MKPLIFIGTNCNLQVYIDAAHRQGYTIAGIIDQDYFGNTTELHGLSVIGSEVEFNDLEKLKHYRDNFDFFIATNWTIDPSQKRDFDKRQRQINLVKQLNIRCINLIDPTTAISGNVKLGQGIFIGSHVAIEPDVQIDDFVQIWYQVGIGHSSKIGENTIIQRQCGLSAIIGKNCYIGMWNKIFNLNTVQIGDNAILYPALYVARDVDSGEIVDFSKKHRRITNFPIEIQ